MRISQAGEKRLIAAAFALVALVALDAGRYLVWPDVGSLTGKNPGRTKMMEIRERQARAQGKDFRMRQVWVGLSGISPYLVKAVLIAEDDKFWHHEGFDFEAMGKALEKDIKKRRLGAGGSTITQQLAKNLYLSPSKNPMRKLKEAILAWRLERNLSKRRILEIYLNVAEWGDGVFGIEAAARRYYGVSASALGPEQAARLAVVLPNPRRYSPVGQSRYVDGRSRIVYGIMARRGIVMPVYDEVMEPPSPDGRFENATSAALHNHSGIAAAPLDTGEPRPDTAPGPEAPVGPDTLDGPGGPASP